MESLGSRSGNLRIGFLVGRIPGGLTQFLCQASQWPNLAFGGWIVPRGGQILNYFRCVNESVGLASADAPTLPAIILDSYIYYVSVL